MPNFNQITLIGHMTRDPETRQLQSGSAVCEFGLAVNHKYGDHEEVCFVDVSAWGKTGEVVQNYVTKGRAIMVVGRLKQDNWTSPEGQKRSKHCVVAEKVVLLGAPKDNGPAGDAQREFGQPSDYHGGPDNPPF